MTTKEKIEDIESKIKVNEITVEKFGRTFQIYPWLKGRLFHKHITGSETMQRKTAKVLLQQVLSVFYGCWNLFRKNEIWIFTSSSERRLIDGKYFDKLFDYIGNESGKKSLIIELRLFKLYPYRKIASKRAVSKSVFMLLEEVYARLFLKIPEVQNQEELNALYSEFEGSISQDEIIKKYLAQYKMMRFWLKLLPTPKEVYLSVSYTNFGYIRAFKEKGIRVVEFQHGLMTKNHSAYWYQQDFDPIQFPDQIASVGEQEVGVFSEENKFPVQNVIPVGSYILDRYAALDEKAQFSSPIRILFAMQDGVISDKLAMFIVELLSRNRQMEVVIQPRRTSKEEYLSKFPELSKATFSEEDFYSALIKSDIHVTVYSTTAIEALSLGRQNILVNLDGLSKQHLTTKLGANAFTTIVEDVSSFVKAVEELKIVEKQSIKDSNAMNVKPNYKENIQQLINEKNQ